MEPIDPAGGDRIEPRRPLLMDPAGARPSGFAPPTATGASTGSSSVLASGGPPAPAVGALTGEAAFGPVSQVVRVSVRSASSRLDLVLPDRSSIAETLETVLELAPRSLREQAIAHGGWILRTAAGEVLAGSTTLLDQGIVDGSTLFLTGVDSGGAAVAYDDVADAVAAASRQQPSGLPRGFGRRVALSAAAVFGAVGLLALLWAGPPWTPITVTLGGAAVLAAVAAGWLSRGVGDVGAAVFAGIVCVVSSATAVAVTTAGPAALLPLSATSILLGGGTAIGVAVVMVALIGARAAPLIAAVTGSLVICLAAFCCLLFTVPAMAGAAVAVGVSLCAMPLVPRMALALAGPATDTTDPAAATDAAIDPEVVAGTTRRAFGYITGQVLGLSWAALAGCVVLAVSDDATAQVLAAVAGVGLLLRARLFPTLGQRLPLLIAGLGSLVAVLLALMTSLEGGSLLIAVALPALVAMLVSLLLGTLRRPLSPELARGLEILDVLIAVVLIPLVAAVLGLFTLVRGIGG